MLVPRVRAVMLGAMAVMLLGAVTASTASALGPWWYRLNAKGAEEKIEPNAPENFKGGGGEQRLLSEIGAEKIEITAEQIQVKGAIFNGPHQGQIKVELVYHQPKLKIPNLANCGVTVGTNNIVVAKGHLMWKWNGTKEQLLAENQTTAGQTWDIGFTSVEPQVQEPFVEEVDLTKSGIFTTVRLSGAGCAALAGTFTVAGSEVAVPNLGLGTFSRNLSTRTLAAPQVEPSKGFLQHYQTGNATHPNQGAKLGLVFGEKVASLIGQTNTTSEQQEIAVKET
jgi:hypothetical protein